MKNDSNMILCCLVCVLIVLVLYRIIVKACQRKESFKGYTQITTTQAPQETTEGRYNNAKIKTKPKSKYIYK